MSSHKAMVSKKHKSLKIKTEPCEKSQSQTTSDSKEDKDLTHFIKDRVELMRQVFLILRDRELLAMAPDCLRSLRIDDIQEFLLDEVLGISSKRLQSILDNYTCPSDTESSDDSSNERLETISLDSISSEEDIILSHQEQKMKKKNSKKRTAVDKSLKKKNKIVPNNAKTKRNKKIIIPQNDNGNQNKDDNGTGMTVLELLELQARARAIRAQLAAVEVKNVVNDDGDLRSSISDCDEVVIKEEPPDIVEIASSSDESPNETKKKKNKSPTKNAETNHKNADISDLSNIEKNKTNSQSDKIENQPLVRKIKLNRNNLLAAIETKEVNSHTSIVDTINTNLSNSINSHATSSANENNKIESSVSVKNNLNDADVGRKEKKYEKNASVKKYDNDAKKGMSDDDDEITLELSDSEKMDLLEELHSPKSNNETCLTINNTNNEDLPNDSGSLVLETDKQSSEKIDSTLDVDVDKNTNDGLNKSMKDTSVDSITDLNLEFSDGECSYSSDGIEITETKSEILCISDGEDNTNKKKRIYCKRKMSDSESQIQTDLDMSEKTDQELKTDAGDQALPVITSETKDVAEEIKDVLKDVVQNDNSIEGSDYVFEISDDSDDETLDSFSKEPTREEIEELSRKIDTEIEREGFDILGANTIDLKIQDDGVENASDTQNDAGVSWKSRWLNSDRVKKVLATSNLCNALRKKNKELKSKLEKGANQSLPIANQLPPIETEAVSVECPETSMQPDEGSVSHYETLMGSSKYVNPIAEQSEEKSMAVDAKQLMKMYKRLLKMHNLSDGEKSIKDKKAKKEKKKHKKMKKEKKKEKSEQTQSTD